MQSFKYTKLISALIAMAMIITASVPFLVFADPVSAQPEITVVGTTIKGSDEFFELSLKVDTHGVGFSTVGIALQYDTSIITPVAWDSAGTNVPVTGTNWQNVSAIPAVSPAEISGKTALTYKDEDDTKHMSYLYLSSEIPLPSGTAEPVAGQSLSRDGDEPATSSDPAASVEPSTDPGASSEPTESSEPEASSEPSTAPSLEPTADPNVFRTITIRFRYADNGETDEDAIKAARQANKAKVLDPVNGFAAGRIVSLASDEIAAASPVGQSLVYSADNRVTEFYYTKDNDATTGLKIGTLLTNAPKFVLEQDGETANSGGGADPANFVAVVYFDWDEETLLGASVVDAGDREGIELLTNQYAATLLPPNAGFDMSAWDDTKAQALDVYDTSYPLTSHAGYTFGKWVEFSSTAFTIYGDTVRQNDVGSIDPLPAPDSPDYANMNMSKGVVLKAAYIANSAMSGLSSVSSRQFTLSFDESPGSGYFERFGTTANYSVKVKIERKNSDGVGIHRPRTMALRVNYTVGGTQMYSLVNLKNVDTQIAEAVVPAVATRVSYAIIDTGDFPDWVNGANSRNATVSRTPGVTRYQDYTGPSDMGFVLLGATYTVNKIIDENSVAANQLNQYISMLFSATRDNIYWGTDTPVNTLATRMNRIMTNIREGQAKKLSDFIAANPGVTPSPTQKYLSFDEMRSAVKLGGDNYLTPVTN